MEVAIPSINEPTTYDKNNRVKSAGFFRARDRKTKHGQKSRDRKYPMLGLHYSM
jgi:hypothetical protein